MNAENAHKAARLRFSIEVRQSRVMSLSADLDYFMKCAEQTREKLKQEREALRLDTISYKEMSK